MSSASSHFLRKTNSSGMPASLRRSASLAQLSGLNHQIAGLFSHNDTPNIKESAESAVLKLRFLRNEANSLEALRQSPVRVLRQPTPL